jgi:hypothetical protein
MGFFIIPHSQERMTEMNPKNPNCLHFAGSSLGEIAAFRGRSIDAQTMQAFQHLRLHAEELSLELAVRLRVLGKSLAVACPAQEAVIGKRTRGSLAYTNLRRQLDGFLGSLVDLDLTGQRYFPVIRHYFHQALPLELPSCGGDDACRIERVEAVVSLLSDSVGEDDLLTDGTLLSYSL